MLRSASNAARRLSSKAPCLSLRLSSRTLHSVGDILKDEPIPVSTPRRPGRPRTKFPPGIQTPSHPVREEKGSGYSEGFPSKDGSILVSTPRRRGRPRTKFLPGIQTHSPAVKEEKESGYGGEFLSKDESVPVSTPRRRGRPRTKFPPGIQTPLRAVKENESGYSEEFPSENESIPVSTPRRRGRPRTKFPPGIQTPLRAVKENESGYSGEFPSENESIPVSTPRRPGRPRTKFPPSIQTPSLAVKEGKESGYSKEFPSSSSSNLDSPRKIQYNFRNSLSKQTNVRPAVLSMRVKELADQGKIEDAITLVEEAPKSKMSAIVWNTLLHALMMMGKRKRAYSVYIEMKRRGYEPSLATYTTLMRGMSTVEDWSQLSVQLEHCHGLYESYQAYMEKCKEQKWKLELRHDPSVFYFRILGKAGLYQKLFDVFYAMDETGPLAPDQYVYTSLLQVLNRRRSTENLGNLSPIEQNASDAKLIWRKMIKDVERGHLEVDSYIILQILRLLMSGRPADQQFGIDIIRDYLGLAAPGEDPPKPTVRLEPRILQAVLELCNKAKKPRLCTYFAKQVMDLQRAQSPQTRDLKIDCYHIEQVLLALHSLAAVGSLDESARAVEVVRMLKREGALHRANERGFSSSDSLRPQPNTYALALAVCWRCADWTRACDVFELATHLSADDFRDDGRVAAGSMPQPPLWKMNMQSLAHMARTAIMTEDKAHMRQCLRIVAMGVDRVEENEPYESYYKGRLASAVIKMCKLTLEDVSESEKVKWQELRRRSQEVLVDRTFAVKPPIEVEEALGSQSFVKKMQQAIDFEMAAR
ncbi:hypothetical protein M0805_006963 [Coniferiporia weirii]|nr:hypothetical protein M0805_006963 [Coniferiporia weirii]